MKTAIAAGMDNLAFMAADLIDPAELKLVGFAVPMREAWNIYGDDGAVRELKDAMPVMPLEAAAGLETDVMILAAGNREDEEALRYMLLKTGYRGEVISLYEHARCFSARAAVIRKLAWRLEELKVSGAAADLGAGRGDAAWQMNALMPGRTLYLFDTFCGYDERDAQRERAMGLSEARAGQFALSAREQENIEALLLGRMPYPERAVIRKGWFPETAFDLEDETFALVYMEAGLYGPTFSGIQYFYPRLCPGGVIVLKDYEDGKSLSVRRAVEDLEKMYGAFQLVPLCDLEGTAVILKNTG